MNKEGQVQENSSPSTERSTEWIGHVSRRAFVGTAALAGAGLTTLSATAQTQGELLGGRQGDSASDPGPQNKLLMEENPDSNRPPFTDHGHPMS